MVLQSFLLPFLVLLSILIPCTFGIKVLMFGPEENQSGQKKKSFNNQFWSSL